MTGNGHYEVAPTHTAAGRNATVHVSARQEPEGASLFP